MTPHKLTPVPEPFLQGIDETMAVVRRDLHEIKPQVREARDGVIALKAQMEATKDRLESLEDRTNDLANASPCDCSGVMKELVAKATATATGLQAAQSDLRDMRAARDRLYYWLAGVIITVIGGAVGWIVTLATVQTDVRHLTEAQSRVTTEVDKLRQATSLTANKLDTVQLSLDRAASSQRRSPSYLEWYETLSEREKLRLRKAGHLEPGATEVESEEP